MARSARTTQPLRAEDIPATILYCNLPDVSYNQGMNDMAAIPGFYTVDEAARIIGKSHSQVCRYIRHGLLSARTVGKSKLLQQADVHEFTPPPRGNPLLRQRKA